MSEHDNDADRDLDAFLNRQSPVSKAWREAVAEQRVPDALDAAVLAAAVEARPVPTLKPVPRLRRWRVPIGLAASLVLGFGVLREAQRDDLARAQLLGEQAAVAAKVEKRTSDEARARMAADATERFAEAARAEAEPEASGTPPQAARGSPVEPSRAAAAATSPAATAPAAPRLPSPPPPPPAYASPPPMESPILAAPMLPRDDEPPQRAADMFAERSARDAQRNAKAAAPPVSRSADSSALIAGKAAPSAAAVERPSLRTAEDWRPAQYRDLRLGLATVDDVLRRDGAPEVDTDIQSNEALLPDGRRAHRLFDYGRKLDPRGRVRLYFDATSDALAWVNLVLDPPLSLAAVQAAEGLVGDGIPRAADVPPCDARPTPPGEPAWPQIRSWPGQGAQLLLAGPDRVVEISYLERCH